MFSTTVPLTGGIVVFLSMFFSKVGCEKLYFDAKFSCSVTGLPGAVLSMKLLFSISSDTVLHNIFAEIIYESHTLWVSM